MICREGIYLHVPSTSKMAGMMRFPGINDDKAVTVVFGTLMLILITITVASGIAVMVSAMQKDAMEREEYRIAVSNEDIKIVSIQPTINKNTSQWESAKLTLLNLNTKDSSIKGISFNNVYATNFMVYNSSNFIEKEGSYPVVYNYNRMIKIPAQKTVSICLNFSNITILSREEINTSGWNNTSQNYTIPLNNNIREIYSLSAFPESIVKTQLFNNTRNATLSDFDLDLTEGTITLFGSLAGGALVNNTNYVLNYNLSMEPFMKPVSVKDNQPVQVKIMTSYINTFEKFFTPPVPMTKVNYYTEYRNGTLQPYLILDASGSFDTDGYIVSYKWSVNSTNDSSALSGIIVRSNPTNTSNLTVDLELTDDTGMVSRLSDVSGAIVIK
ncbi:MAG: hypothetical protein ACC612_09925 [Methanomethylovorans sp.]|uniref:hypothetical protein n=1 Tax=Methanomethylovorans sp. TaxID=2758717 RepID=UPI00353072D0